MENTRLINNTVLSERIKTRDEYADGDKKEAKKLFKSLIGIFNRCSDPAAKKMVERLSKLSEAADKIDYASFSRRYNYVPVQRRKEDDKVFNDGFTAAIEQFEEDGFLNENNTMGKTIRLTESDLHEMVVSAVNALRENYFYGMDEGGNGESKREDDGPATPDDGRPDDSKGQSAQNKRDAVLSILRNQDNNFSDVRRRNIIYRLWNISDDGDYDTYRSLFSKCLNPDDSSHQFSDSQINIIYDMITDIV